MTSALMVGRKVRLSWNGATLLATVVNLDTSYPDTAYAVSIPIGDDGLPRESWMDGATHLASVAHYSQIIACER